MYFVLFFMIFLISLNVKKPGGGHVSSSLLVNNYSHSSTSVTNSCRTNVSYVNMTCCLANLISIRLDDNCFTVWEGRAVNTTQVIFNSVSHNFVAKQQNIKNASLCVFVRLRDGGKGFWWGQLWGPVSSWGHLCRSPRSQRWFWGLRFRLGVRGYGKHYVSARCSQNTKTGLRVCVCVSVCMEPRPAQWEVSKSRQTDQAD